MSQTTLQTFACRNYSHCTPVRRMGEESFSFPGLFQSTRGSSCIEKEPCPLPLILSCLPGALKGKWKSKGCIFGTCHFSSQILQSLICPQSL